MTGGAAGLRSKNTEMAPKLNNLGANKKVPQRSQPARAAPEGSTFRHPCCLVSTTTKPVVRQKIWRGQSNPRREPSQSAVKEAVKVKKEGQDRQRY